MKHVWFMALYRQTFVILLVEPLRLSIRIGDVRLAVAPQVGAAQAQHAASAQDAAILAWARENHGKMLVSWEFHGF